MAPQSRPNGLGLSVPGGQIYPLPSARPPYLLTREAVPFSGQAFPLWEGASVTRMAGNGAPGRGTRPSCRTFPGEWGQP